MRRVLSELVRRPSDGRRCCSSPSWSSAALAAPWLAPFSPDDQPFDGLSLEGAPLPPGAQYWLGTDTLGRDLLSRLLFGARTSLVIGLVANGVAVAIGMLVGIVAGYLRGAGRQRADALHRPDDGLPGAAARHRARGAAAAEPVDRRAWSSRW